MEQAACNALAAVSEGKRPSLGQRVARCCARPQAALGVSRQTIHELLKEDRAITPLMALRLSRLFGNSPTFG